MAGKDLDKGKTYTGDAKPAHKKGILELKNLQTTGGVHTYTKH